MAKLYGSSGKKYVVTEAGDTLSAIALKYKNDTNPKNASYQQIAKWNNIPNPNVISRNMTIYLYNRGSSSSSSGSSGSSSTKKRDPNMVYDLRLGLSTTDENTLLAMWSWDKEKDTESYNIAWEYVTMDGKTLREIKSNTVNSALRSASRYCTYGIPKGAKKVKVCVCPVSVKEEYTVQVPGEDGKTKTEKRTRTKHTGWKYCSKVSYTDGTPLETPDAPSIKLLNDGKLWLETTISSFKYDYTKFKSIQVQIEVYRNSASSPYKKTNSWIEISKSEILNENKKWKCTVIAGSTYRARYRLKCDGLLSDWSKLSTEIKTPPTTPNWLKCEEFVDSITETNKHSVKVMWDVAVSAEGYKLQYIKTDPSKSPNWTSDPNVQNISIDASNTSNGIPPCEVIIRNLDPGVYHFRVCATLGGSESTSTSPWTDELVMISLGDPPGPPTVWSSTKKAAMGDVITLYWVHNSQDNSKQRWFDFHIVYSTDDWETETVLVTNINKRNATDTDTRELIELYSSQYFKVYRMYDKYTKGTQLYAELDTSVFSSLDADVKLKWQVKTAGLTNEYGDFCSPQEIDIYITPTLDLIVTDQFTIEDDGTIVLPNDEDLVPMDTLVSFPFFIKPSVSPPNQTPLGYHLVVKSLGSYETVDRLGNSQIISAGDEVYSQYFDISGAALIEMSAGNIDLENNAEYEIICEVSLDSGLTAQATSNFTVSWTDEFFAPDAEFILDTATYSLTIRPYCEYLQPSRAKVNEISGEYIEDTTEEGVISEDVLMEDVYTTSGEKVSFGADLRGRDIYYCVSFEKDTDNNSVVVWYKVTRNSDETYVKSSKIDISTIKNKLTTNNNAIWLGSMPTGNFDGENEIYEETFYCSTEVPVRVPDVTLGVYRREFDGSFTEIATGLANTDDTEEALPVDTYVIDPHPPLDYGRYRITARTNSTGAISYTDVSAYPIGGKSIIIQWDEDWSTFEGMVNDLSEELAEPPWTGSLLKLPYNIDVTDTTSPEVTHVNYVGRKHPVSYHGTHLGETATWNVTVPKEDTETLYQLRRLKVWMGNVYVREPSGTGYWATITVSDPRKHNELTVQVSINITRVEGGI